MDFTAALIAENTAFAELLRDADLSTPVPTCPGWTLEQLLRHVGRGERWCTAIVAQRATEMVDPRTVPGGKPPAGQSDKIAWLHEGIQALVSAVDRTGADTTVWTFIGPRPAGWWIRRRANEIAVHRADAAIALDTDFQIDPELAADVITEWLERVVVQVDDALQDGQSLHLHATDPGLGVAEWTVHGGSDGIAFDHEHGIGATTALRGPARDLMLAIVRRRTASELGLEIFGDEAVWDTWLARTPF